MKTKYLTVMLENNFFPFSHEVEVEVDYSDSETIEAILIPEYIPEKYYAELKQQAIEQFRISILTDKIESIDYQFNQ
jgi:hypothetical protein